MTRLITAALVCACLSAPAVAQKMIKVAPDTGTRPPVLSQPVLPQVQSRPNNPAPAPQPPDLSNLSLAEAYRALDLYKFIGRGVTRGAALDGLLRAFQAEQFDDDPALTQNDYRLRADLDRARRRADLASQILRYDLDADLVATEEELHIGARAHVSQSRQPVALTEEQIEQLVLQRVATFLVYDADGDRNVTLAELYAWVETQMEPGVPTGPQRLSMEWDVNGDGAITEIELRRAADAALDLIDMDRDGLLAQQELDLTKTALIRRKGQIDNKARGAEVRCALPSVPAETELVVVQADKGSGVTDLDFDGDRSAVVRMAELVIPAGDRPIHVIASMRSTTVLHLTGAGAGRVRGVTGVAAPVGVLTGGDTAVAQTQCFAGFLGIRVREPGGIRSEFERALGRRVDVLIEAKTLGRVDLDRARNTEGARLEGDLLGTLDGDAALVADWLLQFDPGGYQALRPETIRATTPVTRLKVPPLEIGLMHLAMEGALDFAEGPTGRPVARIRTEGTPSRPLTTTAPNTARPSQTLLHVVARRYFEMPAGFSDEPRAIRVIVPEGVPVPKGIPGWNKVR